MNECNSGPLCGGGAATVRPARENMVNYWSVVWSTDDGHASLTTDHSASCWLPCQADVLPLSDRVMSGWSPRRHYTTDHTHRPILIRHSTLDRFHRS